MGVQIRHPPFKANKLAIPGLVAQTSWAKTVVPSSHCVNISLKQLNPRFLHLQWPMMEDREQGQTHCHPILPILCGLREVFGGPEDSIQEHLGHVLLVCWFQGETSWFGSLRLIPRLLLNCLQKRPLYKSELISCKSHFPGTWTKWPKQACKLRNMPAHQDSHDLWASEHLDQLCPWRQIQASEPTCNASKYLSKSFEIKLISKTQGVLITTSNITSKTWSKRSRLPFCSCSVFFLGVLTVSWIQEELYNTMTHAHTETHFYRGTQGFRFTDSTQVWDPQSTSEMFKTHILFIFIHSMLSFSFPLLDLWRPSHHQ